MNLFFIILLVFVFILFLIEELYRYIFCRRTSALLTCLFCGNGHDKKYYRARDAAAERLKSVPCETYTLLNSRGENLKGFYYPCGAAGKKIVFIIHGYRSEHL